MAILQNDTAQKNKLFTDEEPETYSCQAHSSLDLEALRPLYSAQGMILNHAKRAGMPFRTIPATVTDPDEVIDLVFAHFQGSKDRDGLFLLAAASFWDSASAFDRERLGRELQKLVRHGAPTTISLRVMSLLHPDQIDTLQRVWSVLTTPSPPEPEPEQSPDFVPPQPPEPVAELSYQDFVDKGFAELVAEVLGIDGDAYLVLSQLGVNPRRLPKTSDPTMFWLNICSLLHKGAINGPYRLERLLGHIAALFPGNNLLAPYASYALKPERFQSNEMCPSITP